MTDVEALSRDRIAFLSCAALGTGFLEASLEPGLEARRRLARHRRHRGRNRVAEMYNLDPSDVDVYHFRPRLAVNIGGQQFTPC
jgi:hypothetical protein